MGLPTTRPRAGFSSPARSGLVCIRSAYLEPRVVDDAIDRIGLPRGNAVFDDVPRHEAIVALGLEQVEGQPRQRLVGRNIERARGHGQLYPIERAFEARLLVALERLG